MLFNQTCFIAFIGIPPIQCKLKFNLFCVILGISQVPAMNFNCPSYKPLWSVFHSPRNVKGFKKMARLCVLQKLSDTPPSRWRGAVEGSLQLQRRKRQLKRCAKVVHHRSPRMHYSMANLRNLNTTGKRLYLQQT